MNPLSDPNHEGLFLTPRAHAEALALLDQEERYKGLPMRLYIEGKGCDGFYYGVNFDAAEADDLHFMIDGLHCIVDSRAFIFCKGSTIDFVDDERGRGFLVDNPKERNFRGKFYKKSTWKTKLEALAEPKAQPSEA